MVAQRSDTEIQIGVEQGLTESVNPRRKIGTWNRPTVIVVLAHKLVTERFICLYLDADREFLWSGGAQHDEIRLPLLTAETIERNGALWICVGENHLAVRE